MLKRCLLLLVALLSLSGATARAADTTPAHQVFLPVVRDPGRLIIYSTSPLTAGNPSQLFIQRIGGPPAVEFKPAVNSTSLSEPDWSPDGKLIAFVASLEGGIDQLYVSKPDGSQPRLLVTLQGLIDSPAWSPDSSRIVFTNRIAGTLHLINADGTGLRRLNDSQFRESNASWSPDGRRLVLARVDPIRTPVYLFWVVYDLESGEVEGLKTGATYVRSPDWSPDGSTIAFVEQITSPAKIVLITPDGSGRREVFTVEGTDLTGISRIAWSPDGQHILALCSGPNTRELRLISVATGTNEKVDTYSPLNNPSVVETFSWGPWDMP